MAINPLPDIPPSIQLSEMGSEFSQPGVYFLWHFEAVVYVGQSRDMTIRIVHHMGDKGKQFDAVSCEPCEPKNLIKTERYFIEKLLPKYNRCSFSEAIRRIWVGHMDDRPPPDRDVNPEVAAQVLGVTADQLQRLRKHGLVRRVIRLPRSNKRRSLYSMRDLHQFAAQNARAIKLVRMAST